MIKDQLNLFAGRLETVSLFEKLCALAFDPHDPDHVRDGYSRPDSEAVLSYDAMETLIAVSTNAAVRQSLQQARSAVNVQGASRQLIAFTCLHELKDQTSFMLFVNHERR